MKKILSADPHLKAVTLLKNLVEIKFLGKKKKNYGVRYASFLESPA